MRKKQVVTVDADTSALPPLTRRQRAELEAARTKPNSDIDYSDIPELGPEFWANARRGVFYRPVKKQITLRLDADVLDWFKAGMSPGKGYQTRINAALRVFVTAAEEQANRQTASSADHRKGSRSALKPAS